MNKSFSSFGADKDFSFLTKKKRKVLNTIKTPFRLMRTPRRVIKCEEKKKLIEKNEISTQGARLRFFFLLASFSFFFYVLETGGGGEEREAER